MDLKMCKTQIASQTKRFYNVWNEYNADQLKFRDDEKSLLMRKCKIADNDLTDEEIEQKIHERESGIWTGNYIAKAHKVTEDMVRDLEVRHSEFIKLEKQIEEVRDLFLEIANMVESQGDMIDNIEYQIEDAFMNMQGANKELKTAVSYKKKADKKKFVCAIIVFVLIVLVVLLVLHQFGII